MQPIKGNSGIGNTLVIEQKFLLKIKMYNYQPLLNTVYNYLRNDGNYTMDLNLQKKR